MDFAASQPKEVIELFVSCRKLTNMDYNSTSDPFVSMLMSDGHHFTKIAETEVKENTLNPDFAKSIIVDYFFEKVQPVRFEVYDKDPSSLDYIGACEATIGKIAGARNQTFITDLVNKGGHKRGTLIVRAESVKASNNDVVMKLGGKKIANVEGFFGKSDPFLVISRARTSSADASDQSIEWVRVFETEPVMNNLNPNFNSFSIRYQRLCNSDKYIPLRVDVYDFEKSGKHQYIGGATTTLDSMLQMEGGVLDFINQKKAEKKGKKYTNSGQLVIHQCRLIERPSFIDYLRSGWAISLQVAVDFTASNGEPSDPRSLHYIGGAAEGKLNGYEAAILQVGNIVQEYDFDKRFPVVGFGGIPRFMGATEVSHCFNLTPDNTEVLGVQGILDAYRFSIHNAGLYGPTLFAPLLEQTYYRVKQTESQQIYHTLLILTDGAIMDMQPTKNWLVALSTMPISIIIVGIGTADFSKMEELDADKVPLKDHKGQKATRDIVQFVEFNKYMHSPTALAEEVLREEPTQLVQFMLMHNIMPQKKEQLLPPAGTLPPEYLAKIAPGAGGGPPAGPPGGLSEVGYIPPPP